MLIFIFLAASPPRAEENFACAKRTRKRKRQRGGGGQEDGGGCAGGWQSVEASGADQWPDGGNSGILTLQPAKGAAAGAADAAAATAGAAGAGAAAAAASCSRYTVCGAACTQRQRMLVTRMAADREEEVEQERKSPRRC